MTHSRKFYSLLGAASALASFSGCGADGGSNANAGSGGNGLASASGGTTLPAVGGATTVGGGGTTTMGGSALGGSATATGGVGLTTTGGSSSTGGTISTATGGIAPTGGSSSNTGGSTSAGTGGNTSPPTGGRGSTGGNTSIGSGGSNPTGGTAGNNPTGGVGGGDTGGTGGLEPTGGTGGGAPTGGSTSVESCEFDVDPSTSDSIPTVGIVEWSTTLSGVDSAQVEFGTSTSYEYVAPVDLEEANYRTLLLGMKANTEVHFRIVANAGSAQCASDDYTITTGNTATGLPNATIRTNDASALAGGFKVTSRFQGGPAFILDRDGDIVWWYNVGETTRARQSYDGKHMWIAKGNVPQGMAQMTRVGMDGSGEQDFTGEFSNLNHDFTVLPDETVIFIGYSSSAMGCDKVAERTPDGNTRTIVENVCPMLGVSASHLNAIHYDHSDDTIIVSELDSDSYTKIDRSGNMQWILGGNQATFTNQDYKWDANHGFHILPNDRFLIFNNGAPGSGQGSVGIELELNHSANTASQVWTYASSGGIQNTVMGDIQRLPNGNTLVTYSIMGIVHEVTSSGSVVEEMEWGLGSALGYMMHRESLYGPPPR